MASCSHNPSYNTPLPQLKEFSDGFDCLLLSMPPKTVLEEEELDTWCDKLQRSPLQSLHKPLQLIAEWHADDVPSFTPPATEDPTTSSIPSVPIVQSSPEYMYPFSPEAMQVYRSFSNEMARSMNAELQGPSLPRGNISKDKTTMIRYHNQHSC